MSAVAITTRGTVCGRACDSQTPVVFSKERSSGSCHCEGSSAHSRVWGQRRSRGDLERGRRREKWWKWRRGGGEGEEMEGRRWRGGGGVEER